MRPVGILQKLLHSDELSLMRSELQLTPVSFDSLPIPFLELRVLLAQPGIVLQHSLQFHALAIHRDELRVILVCHQAHPPARMLSQRRHLVQP
jgi:hypothetical protein